MTLDPETKFGIRGAGRTGARTVGQKYALIAGLVYVGVGVVGFFATGFDNLTLTSNEALLGIFYLNPFHNIVHIAVGGLWLFGALVLSGPATDGMNVAIGGFYVLAAVLGFLGYLDLVNVKPALDPDNFLHLISGGLTLLFGLMGGAIASDRGAAYA